MRQLYFFIFKLIPQPIKDLVPMDKILHFLVGFIIAAIVWWFSTPMMGLLAATVAGVAKEVHDATKNYLATKKGLPPPHGVEVMDAIVTAMGGLAVFFWADAVSSAILKAFS